MQKHCWSKISQQTRLCTQYNKRSYFYLLYPYQSTFRKDNQFIMISKVVHKKSNMAAGPASYCMTDTMGRMHSDAQFAGSSSRPVSIKRPYFMDSSIILLFVSTKTANFMDRITDCTQWATCFWWVSNDSKKSPPFPKVIDITCLRDIFQFALVEDSSHVWLHSKWTWNLPDSNHELRHASSHW